MGNGSSDYVTSRRMTRSQTQIGKFQIRPPSDDPAEPNNKVDPFFILPKDIVSYILKLTKYPPEELLKKVAPVCRRWRVVAYVKFP